MRGRASLFERADAYEPQGRFSRAEEIPLSPCRKAQVTADCNARSASTIDEIERRLTLLLLCGFSQPQATIVGSRDENV